MTQIKWKCPECGYSDQFDGRWHYPYCSKQLEYEVTISEIGTNDDLGTLAGLKRMDGEIQELISESEKTGLYDPPITWIPCAMRNPIGPGTYLCFEPDIGPGPDFVFLRWDMDRGWRDDNDAKGFPTHWVRLEAPGINYRIHNITASKDRPVGDTEGACE